MITDALITYLINHSSISSDRIYPIRARQGVDSPLAIVYLDDQIRYKSHDGTNETIDAKFEIDVYGDAVSSAQTMASEILTVLTDYNGTMGTHYIYDIDIDSENNGFETDTELYSHSIFLTVTYR